MSDGRGRFILGLTNAAVACLLVAVVLIGVALVGVALDRLLFFARPTPSPPAPRPFELPAASPAPGETIELGLHEAHVAPPPATTTRLEDERALEDADRAFGARYRVLMAVLDRDPRARQCILVPRGSSEQIVLAPGERTGDYLLLSIEPVAGEPRGARLRFSDLRRGLVVPVTFAPAP